MIEFIPDSEIVVGETYQVSRKVLGEWPENREVTVVQLEFDYPSPWSPSPRLSGTLFLVEYTVQFGGGSQSRRAYCLGADWFVREVKPLLVAKFDLVYQEPFPFDPGFFESSTANTTSFGLRQLYPTCYTRY